METTYFVLGMLTIVAVIILTALVVGMVKINKLEKQKQNLYQLCISIEGDLRRLIEETHRDISDVENTIVQRIDEIDRETHREIDQTRSYIDSRIDKVVASGTLKNGKQQLNG